MYIYLIECCKRFNEGSMLVSIEGKFGMDALVEHRRRSLEGPAVGTAPSMDSRTVPDAIPCISGFH